MKQESKKANTGFTLLEVLLVLAIISSVLIIVMSYFSAKTDEAKRDSAVMKYEQILNAGLAYYINYSNWPNNIPALGMNRYLPTRNGADATNLGIFNPWGGGFTFYRDATTGTFSICSMVKGSSAARASAEANIVAGRLPMAYVAESCPAQDVGYTVQAPAPAACAATSCAVVSTVNIPGQNLNNARSVNFAGVYHNGACVPAPVCPNTMVASIIVAPISVSGTYDGSVDVYPLSSFTAYAKGASATGAPVSTPLKCTSSTETAACDLGAGIPSPANTYWRVCLDVVTEKGRISGGTWTKDSGAVMAITRCVPSNEPSGSDFTVFQSF